VVDLRAQIFALAAKVVCPDAHQQQFGGSRRNVRTLQLGDLALLGADLTPHPRSRCERSTASQRAQVLGRSAEVPDHGRVAEVASRGIAYPAERDRPDVARLAESASARITARVRIEALHCLAGSDAVVGGHRAT
jgi:hypothetical protein